MTPLHAAELMEIIHERLPITPELEARWKKARRNYRRKLAVALYKQTAKGKAMIARYNKSAKHRASAKRYRDSARGQQMVAELNDKRIFIGKDYRGRVKTTEHAEQIRSHIKEKLLELKQRFADGEKAEGVPASQVSPEAAV